MLDLKKNHETSAKTQFYPFSAVKKPDYWQLPPFTVFLHP
jgi:hypothetical protein